LKFASDMELQAIALIKERYVSYRFKAFQLTNSLLIELN
jgi:hypothetical protein